MRTRRRGFALILTLWILALLTALLSSLTMLTAMDNRATAHARQAAQASSLARGALRRVAAELVPRDDLGRNEALAQVRAEKTGRWVVDGRDWSVRQLRDDEPPPAAEEQVLCEVSVEDARLPLARLNKSVLGKLPRMTPVLAESIVTALGLEAAADGKPGAGAAAKPPAGATAASAPQPLERSLPVEALLGVEAVRGEVYDGTPEAPGLKALLTRFSDGRIYVNRAPKEVIQAIPGVDEATAIEIHTRVAKGQPFERVEDLQHVLGVTPAIFKSLQGWVKVTPAYYRIVARPGLQRATASSTSAVVSVTPALHFVYLQGT